MTAPARAAAYRALAALDAGRRDLPSALAATRELLRDDRDRTLAAAIVHGTLRWQRACDHLIGHFARRPLAALDDAVRIVLRMSLYQILHLDRVPASAIVDDAVNLTKGAGKTSAAGFVNGVLRSTLRQRHRLPLPPRPADPSDAGAALQYLGISLSHPDWLVARWMRRVGFENAERWALFDNAPAPLTLAVNRLRGTRDEVRAALAADGVETTATTFAPFGLQVLSGNPLRANDTARPFVVQDEASQVVAVTVGARPGHRVLDLCAAPGNKAVLLLGDMADTGVLAACDVRPRRVALLRATLGDAGGRHGHAIHVAPEGHVPFVARFDRVLVDAPCSGLGTIRRDPDIKWRREESDLAGLADRQVALLARASAVLAPGGRLVYATCSGEPEENEMVVDRFLATHPAFRVVDLRAEAAPALAPLVDARGMLRTLPFSHGLEAFFAAALERAS